MDACRREVREKMGGGDKKREKMDGPGKAGRGGKKWMSGWKGGE